MICNNCGTEFLEGIFCPECGTRCESTVKENVLEKQKQVEPEQVKELKQQKKNNNKAILSLILGIISWIGILTVVLPVVCGIWSFILGIKALKNKAKRKGCAIIGIILSTTVLTFIIWTLIQPTTETGNTDVIYESTVEVLETQNSEVAMKTDSTIVEKQVAVDFDASKASKYNDNEIEAENWEDIRDYYVFIDGLYACESKEIDGINAELRFARDTSSSKETLIIYPGNGYGYNYGNPFYISGELKLAAENVYGMEDKATNTIIMCTFEAESFSVDVIQTDMDEIKGIEGKYSLISENSYEIMPTGLNIYVKAMLVDIYGVYEHLGEEIIRKAVVEFDNGMDSISLTALSYDCEIIASYKGNLSWTGGNTYRSTCEDFDTVYTVIFDEQNMRVYKESGIVGFKGENIFEEDYSRMEGTFVK